MTQDFDDAADTPDGGSGEHRYRYNPALDPNDGQVSGLNAWRRSQGRDHIQQLDTFYDQGLISEVLYLVRIGKEASVYCCRGGQFLARRIAGVSARRPDELDARQTTSPGGPLSVNGDGKFGPPLPLPRRGAGGEGSGRQADQPTSRQAEPLVAAKVYRARQYRFKNDAVYQEERSRGMRGQAARALAKKTDFGRKVQTGSWVNHEFETLKELYAAGCDVPKPLLSDDDAILMEFIGDEDGPAPQLNRVQLNREDAEEQFERVMNNVEIALACNRVHGDLSAHNILYREGQAMLIDFPQAVDARFNSQAEQLLHRDVANVCRYFNQYGVGADAWKLADDLWRRWTFGEL